MSRSKFDDLRALIVEDNAHMRTLLRGLLGAVGIKDVCEAPNGRAGIDMLRERKCDIVLSDLMMQPMDGIDFTHTVRKSEHSPNPFVPIIMITGHTEKSRVEAARDAGVTEFLAKPVTAHNLFSRIAEIVERPRAFVRCDGGYFGPDRRRRQVEDYAGPWRRKEDFQDMDMR